MLTPEEVNKRANEIVESIKEIVFKYEGRSDVGTLLSNEIAILHVEKIVKLWKFVQYEIKGGDIVVDNLLDNQQVLENLKERIK